MTAINLVEILENKYPTLSINNNTETSIRVSAEDGTTATDGFDLFNYYAEDYKEVRYVMGVHKEIGDLLNQYGWWAEWQDAGTIMLWED